MSLPLLALGTYAEEPFTVPRLRLRIWSVEELLYILKTNPFIIDENLIDRRLFSWLEKSCNLRELARELYEMQKKGKASVADYVLSIAEYTGYLSEEEISAIEEVLSGNAGASDYEREINLADFSLEQGYYQAALNAYDRILLSLPYGERLISGRVLHNKGVALASLFHFEKAAAAFLAAYEINLSPESGRAYLCACRIYLSEPEYICLVAERPGFRDLSLEVEYVYNQVVSDYNKTDTKRTLDELNIEKIMGNSDTYYDGIEEEIAMIKKDYLNAVQT